MYESGLWCLQQLSTELGAFVAGVMVSATEQQEQALTHLEPIKHIFITLFISSTGLIMSPKFLIQHIAVLTVGVGVVIVGKTILVRCPPTSPADLHCLNCSHVF